MIIDDSKTIVAALHQVLRSAGYETQEALDAEAGLELMRRTSPDLVFSTSLPGMNGSRGAARHSPRPGPARRSRHHDER